MEQLCHSVTLREKRREGVWEGGMAAWTGTHEGTRETLQRVVRGCILGRHLGEGRRSGMGDIGKDTIERE